jgi:hypothetical protein
MRELDPDREYGRWFYFTNLKVVQESREIIFRIKPADSGAHITPEEWIEDGLSDYVIGIDNGGNWNEEEPRYYEPWSYEYSSSMLEKHTDAFISLLHDFFKQIDVRVRVIKMTWRSRLNMPVPAAIADVSDYDTTLDTNWTRGMSDDEEEESN